MWSALMGSLQITYFLTEGLFGYSCNYSNRSTTTNNTNNDDNNNDNNNHTIDNENKNARNCGNKLQHP